MPIHRPDFEIFHQLARQHDVVPVFRQLLSDRISPVTAFDVIARDEHAFLLESAVVDGRAGRWSFVSTRPRAVYQFRGDRAVLWRQGRALEEISTTDPLEDLSRLLGKHRCARHEKLPAFSGGLVGYVSYDLARNYVANVDVKSAPPDDRGLPDASFGLYDDLIAFDHFDNTLRVVSNATIDHSKAVTTDALKSIYESACRRIDLLVQRLNQPSMLSMLEIDLDSSGSKTSLANVTREQFEMNVRKCADSIQSRNIERISPSIRLRLQSDTQPMDVYRLLRVTKPGPFMFMLKSPQCTLIGSSPSSLFSLNDGVFDSDQSIKLRSDQTALDVMSARLPPESACGHPRSEAMKLIDEIEPTRRGPYGGAVGYFDYSGDSQVCAAQQVIIWRNGSYDAQAGVEIRADSSPSDGYESCMKEVGALMRSVEIAGRK